jgi:N-acetylglucosaminyl-diphospho-decaprenol L-rhamnosyltransferase
MSIPAAGPQDVVGVVVVTYSPGETLRGLLDSIPAASSRPVAVVLADNGSTDGSVEAAVDRQAGRDGGTEQASRDGQAGREERAGISTLALLRTGGNLGYGAAANAGVQALDPAIEWVMVVNPDLVLAPGSIDALLEAAGRHPDGGAFGPLLTDADGLVYPSARQLPSVGAGIGHAVFGWWWPKNPWTRSYRQDAAEPTERVAGWLSGSCLLLRRKAFAGVDGFDPEFFMYFEDVDLGDRLARTGWSSVYCPTARAVHLGGRSTEREPAAMAEAHHRSAYRYLAKRYRAPWQAPLRWVLRAGLAARSFLSKRSAKVAAGASIPDRRIDRTSSTKGETPLG